ncbi:hypothetical protein STCU_10448 [Strigomonas culicis]|uniref:IBB domain-containing protein n=1 Tax=Strigomonas culicis TaxID=28005 RepID=S9TI40_9TRYP|nr:hypothetical protein STCU_10448 [Strigomonas culicis]|eukprot:EPY17732.1 hypothetical protein STCU_10448 [Strigomonas culicis]
MFSALDSAPLATSAQGERHEPPRGVKRSVTAAEGMERRQRQLRAIRTRAHGRVLQHLRLEEEEGEEEASVSRSAPGTPVAEHSGAEPSLPADLQAFWAVTTGTKPSAVSVGLLPVAAHLLLRDDASGAEVHQGLLVVRKLLTRPRHRPCTAVLAAGLVPRLVALLQPAADAALQHEAAWALTNLCGETVDCMRAVAAADGVRWLWGCWRRPWRPAAARRCGRSATSAARPRTCATRCCTATRSRRCCGCWRARRGA